MCSGDYLLYGQYRLPKYPWFTTSYSVDRIYNDSMPTLASEKVQVRTSERLLGEQVSHDTASYKVFQVTAS